MSEIVDKDGKPLGKMIKKARYFYRLGYYRLSGAQEQAQRHIDEMDDKIEKILSEGISRENAAAWEMADRMRESAFRQLEYVPPEFNVNGRDIRLWTHTNEFMEISKEAYDEILESEERILKRTQSVNAKLKHYHWPIECESEEYLKEICGCDPVVIESSSLNKNKDV